MIFFFVRNSWKGFTVGDGPGNPQRNQNVRWGGGRGAVVYTQCGTLATCLVLQLRRGCLLPACPHQCSSLWTIAFCHDSFGLSYRTLLLFLGCCVSASQVQTLQYSSLSTSTRLLLSFMKNSPIAPVSPWVKEYDKLVIYYCLYFVLTCQSSATFLTCSWKASVESQRWCTRQHLWLSTLTKCYN